MGARRSVEDKLAALESLPDDPAARAACLTEALGDRHCRVAARAAKLAAGGLVYDAIPALRAAFRRFLDKPVKTDPSCHAKSAIVRALVELDCDDVELYLDAIRYRQLEPVWGGTADTAVDVRATAAMGLVGTGYSRALIELAELLHDPEAGARVGAARAIASGNPREAELLLRAKVLSGDPEPAVLGECFSGLLAVEPDESPAFVAGHLRTAHEEAFEAAALALGESRLPVALGYLKTAWNEAYVPQSLRRVLLRAAVLHRSDAAFEWLLAIVADGDGAQAVAAVEELAIYKHNAALAERLDAVVAERGDERLRRALERSWKA